MSSLPERCFRAFLLLLGLSAAPAWAAQVSLSFDSIRHPMFEAEGMALSFDAADEGEADIRLKRLRVGQVEYRELRLHCSGFFFDGRRLDCPKGRLTRDDKRGADRPPLPFSLAWRAKDGFFDFRLDDADAVDLSPLVKRLRGWKPEGKVDFRLSALGDKAKLELALRDVGFSRDEASGKGIVATFDVDAQRKGKVWDWRARLDWTAGELAQGPWRREGGIGATARGSFGATEIDVREARLDVARLGAVDAALRWDRVAGRAKSWRFATERLDLATAMRDWLQPWLSELGFPAWRTEGYAKFSAEARDGRLKRFHAGLEDAALSDSTGTIALRGVNARIPWDADTPSVAEVGVTSGALGDLPVGGFSFPIHLAGNEARIAGIVAPMLDGQFAIDALTLARGADGWRGEFSGSIHYVSMPKLSRALGLPAMAGTFTANIPRVWYDKGTLALDGVLAMAIFDGAIAVNELRIVDAFTAQRRFVVDVTASHLDLGMLTQTFSFGSITGRVDASLRNLEMAGWKPLRFEARLASTPGDFPREVSIGAVRDIAAMDAKGVPVDARRVAERTFGFGYERIAVAAKLANGVCTLEGIARDGDGIVLMQGRGFPSVSIIGYNPRIDWDALVARVREVIAGKSAMLVQ